MANEIQELKFQVGEAWKGVYSSSTAYSLAAVVQDPTGLSVYRSLKSGNVGHPVSDSAWWFRIIDLSSIKAESDRIKALNDAIANDEALRVAAEELRQKKEQQRIAAENQRNEAEQQRISAEQQRVTKETQRNTAEQNRISAEQGRVTAESARVQAEQARVLAETLRANAEDQRAANEQNRIAAEQQRIERAEQDHQRAESDHATYVDSLGAFDISSYHATDGVLSKYADLTAALGTGGANIPDDLRKGGMSVKFVQSSDNKYVQWRYKGTAVTGTPNPFLDTTNWEKYNNVSVSQNTSTGHTDITVGNVTIPIPSIGDLERKLSVVYGNGIWRTFGKTDWNIGDRWIESGKIKEVSHIREDSGNTYPSDFIIIGNADVNAIYIMGECLYLYRNSDLVKITDLQTLLSAIGDLTQLSTISKSSLVEAINEVLSKIGNLDGLSTEDKTNLVTAINELAGKFIINNDIEETIDAGGYINMAGISVGSTFVGVKTTLSGYACVLKLEVTERDKFDFYGIGSANNAFKCYVITDSEDKVIEIYPLTGNIDYRQSPYRITIPQNGANLYVNFASTYNSATDKLIKRDSEVIDLSVLKESTDDNSNAIAKLESELTLKGKKIICFGDSITEFKDSGGVGKSYTDYLRDISNADVVNVGIGGTRLSQRATVVTTPTTTREAYAALDIVSMVEASCNQQFTAQVNAAQYLKDNTEDDNTAIVARLQAIDWSQVDIVTILGGTNDWASSAPLGTSGSYDKSTVYGAINTIFRDITYKYPKIKVFYFCPPIRIIPTSNFKGEFNSARTYNVNEEVLYQHALYRFVNSHTGVWNVNDATLVPASDLYAQSSDVQTYGGVTLESLSQSILQEVKKNHIPICDLYHELWTPYNFTNACNSDLTHPFNGFTQIAAKINSFILSNKSFV